METTKQYARQKWGVFIAATLGYGLYYVCRLSFNVVKKPIVDAGYLTETELGIIGSALFFSYAIGKFANGFLADRLNVRYLMAGGLLMASLVNALLGFAVPFWAFVALWGLNGWVQSIGSPCSVIALNRWFSDKQRGTVYGFWSASHNIGEAATYILTTFIVGSLGWKYGFWSAACLGAAGTVLILIFLRPSSNMLPVAVQPEKKTDKSSVGKKQMEVLKNPMIWMLALSSSFMYICRYAVNSWGVYYFEAAKGYSIIEAGSLISISSVCGVIGTVFSGLISDKFFHGKRNALACLATLLNGLSLALFLFAPHSLTLDIVSMVLFGISIGILICFLGGLMAVDLAPKEAAGAALGVIGIASYIGACIQDVLSGYLIESNKTVVNGENLYDFSTIRIFWIGSAIMSFLLCAGLWKVSKKQFY
jgi:OPA family sugar phosphate sensor protein UhpC-like MFS transporter